MKIPRRLLHSIRYAMTLLALCATSALAADVPATLPIHDKKPGDATKPVKVYILAGQSNMVGMGEIKGAKNKYNALYLTNNPDAPMGPMAVWKVGNYKVLPLTVRDKAGNKTTQPITEGTLEVSQPGVYEPFADTGTLSIQANTLETGLYKLKPGHRYAFKLEDLVDGQTSRFFLKKTDMLGNGDLEAVVKRGGMFRWLINPFGDWIAREDVTYEDARIRMDIDPTPLSPTSNNGKTIGPELGFGHVLGTYHDEQVLLIKTAMGNRALGFDFRPPSSGMLNADNEWESKEYKLMVEGVNLTLKNIDKVVPGYNGQGYELAGFVWWQGHKDRFTPELDTAYEANLVNLINDVRKEFNAPQMPAVVATVGFEGNALQEGHPYWNIFNAQRAVADADKHPAFAGNLATVDTRGYWRETDDSPKGEGHHYNRNAETYYRVGDALGRAMVGLKGGKAEPLPNPNPHQPIPAVADGELTDGQKAKHQAALKPILIDSIAHDYANNPRYTAALKLELAGKRSGKATQFLNDAMYGIVNIYNAAGVHDYDWKPFGPDLNKTTWHYHSFDPAEKKGTGFRGVTWPDGMDAWKEPGFDAKAEGFKAGLMPFGTKGGELEGLRDGCDSVVCGCGIKPNTLWENEVLMLRTTIDVPKLKEGHRYRLVLGGAAHVFSGQGYAIYVDGKLINQSSRGVNRREGGQPRGGHISTELLDELKDGKATLAVYSFLRYDGGSGPFPNGHIQLHLQEQKLPSIEIADAP
ncbi:MAG: sialate O-acetylesterase [Phycisphaeraceae bacterium]